MAYHSMALIHISSAVLATAEHTFPNTLLTLWRPPLPYGYTAIKHPMLDTDNKPLFAIFDISGLSVRVPGCQKLQMTA